jgi:DNA-binding MarR family transcriptional regulator
MPADKYALEPSPTLAIVRSMHDVLWAVEVEWLQTSLLDIEQGAVLSNLYYSPGAIERDLLQMIGAGTTNVSRLLKSLERRGFVELRKETNGRSKRVYPTPAGLELITGLETTMASATVAILRHLKKTELGRLHALLQKVAAQLQCKSAATYRHVGRIDEALREDLEEWARTQKLHFEQSIILSILSSLQGTGVVQRDLPQMLGSSAATVSRLLRDLERRAFVELRQEGNDRSKRVYATSAGLRLIGGFATALFASEKTVLGYLNKTERAELHALLEKVAPELPQSSAER